MTSSLAESAGVDTARSETTLAFARLDLFEDMEAAHAAWSEIEAIAPHSCYQRHDWCSAWFDTIGRARGLTPAIAVARDDTNSVVALLPLGVRRRGPFRLCEFLGGKDANFAFGLFHPDARFDAAETLRLLREAGRLARVDLLALTNQPRDWEGAGNPLAALPHQASPSDGYKARLSGDGAGYLRGRLSKEARKKLRRKEEKLGEIGPVRHVIAGDAAMGRAILQVFAVQKSSLLKRKGVDNPFGNPETQAFLNRIAIAPLERGETAIVELHALLCGARIVATFAGASAARRFSGMVNSFDPEPDLARCSPGDLLLSKIIAAKGAAGCATLDLGVGEARYKAMFCDESERLFDVYVALTPTGRALKIALSGQQRVKRFIKRSPRLWRAVDTFRRLRG